MAIGPPPSAGGAKELSPGRSPGVRGPAVHIPNGVATKGRRIQARGEAPGTRGPPIRPKGCRSMSPWIGPGGSDGLKCFAPSGLGFFVGVRGTQGDALGWNATPLRGSVMVVGPLASDGCAQEGSPGRSPGVWGPPVHIPNGVAPKGRRIPARGAASGKKSHSTHPQWRSPQEAQDSNPGGAPKAGCAPSRGCCGAMGRAPFRCLEMAKDIPSRSRKIAGIHSPLPIRRPDGALEKGTA